jgi:beta-lactam-binding protein with PASTA domain
MLGVGWVCAAETPFGIGDGKVPDLVGKDVCEASRAAADRGLRWRYGPGGDVSAAVLRHDPSVSFTCADDEVVRQSPGPGTDVGEGGVVTLITECTDPERPVGCA